MTCAVGARLLKAHPGQHAAGHSYHEHQKWLQGAEFLGAKVAVILHEQRARASLKRMRASVQQDTSAKNTRMMAVAQAADFVAQSTDAACPSLAPAPARRQCHP